MFFCRVCHVLPWSFSQSLCPSSSSFFFFAYRRSAALCISILQCVCARCDGLKMSPFTSRGIIEEGFDCTCRNVADPENGDSVEASESAVIMIYFGKSNPLECEQIATSCSGVVSGVCESSDNVYRGMWTA